MKWPWRRDGQPSEETIQARQRLERIRSDDVAVNQLAQRARRIMRENNLAPDIIKALRVQR